MSAKQVLVLHGPNLNLLGQREPQIYGTTTLADIDAALARLGDELGLRVSSFQSNHEGDLIERLHACRSDGTRYIIINPAAFTHTSVALRDAIAATDLPFIEVHLSNVHRREAFRHHSFFSDLADAVISGCGAQGYELALRHAAQRLTRATGG